MAEGAGSTSRANEIIGNIDKLMSMADTRKSLEMKLAMQRDGTLPMVPEYFAHCAKYSGPGQYVLCKVKNPAGRCPGWSGTAGPGPGPRGDADPGWGGPDDGGYPSGW